MGNSKSMKNLG